MPSSPPEPRIPPGGRSELGLLNWTLLRIGTRRVGGGPIPNVMLTLARHRSLFRPWIWFASRLMPYGKLPAVDSELVILRVAARCGSDYERHHHTALGKAAGLGPEIIEWSAEPAGTATPAPTGSGIDAARATTLMLAVDELLDTHDLADETWSTLAALYDENQLIELCMLVGQYAMLAGTLNALRTPLEAGEALHNLR